jgi:hypothetical protein
MLLIRQNPREAVRSQALLLTMSSRLTKTDRNRTVESHRQSCGVCHSLAETCGFIIENPLAGHVRIDWFSWLLVI